MNTQSNWVAPITGAATSVLGMIGQRQREQRAMNNQRELMGIQFNNQSELNAQQYRNQSQLQKDAQDWQYEMWQKTNYPAQVEMLKQAGLNPALLYGMKGGGGVTTGSVGAGSAQGGSAQGGQAPAPQHMDLSAIMQGLQLQIAQAQAEKAKAETKQVEAQTERLSYENMVYTEQGMWTELEKQRLEFKKLFAEDNIKFPTHDDGQPDEKNDLGYQQISASILKEINEYRKQAVETHVSESTQEAQIRSIIAETALKELLPENMEAKTEQVRELTNKIWHEIWQGWTSQGINGVGKIIDAIAKFKGIQAAGQWSKGFKRGIEEMKK